MNQTEKFLDTAGDEWLKRNRAALGKHDKVMPMLNVLVEERGFSFTPEQRVLEIGCANGWLLQQIKEKYGCVVAGIEPSAEAVAEATASGLDVHHGVASAIPAAADAFNVVILGFCMAYIPPMEWFQVVAETDRVLVNGGLLIIFDYVSPRPMVMTHWINGDKNNPENTELFYYDWPKLWEAHPSYRKVAEILDTHRVHVGGACEMVYAMRKNLAGFYGYASSP